MKKNYTHLVLLIDRSGSMWNIKNDMEGGIKTFFDEQRKVDGECTVTIAQFDDRYDVLCRRKNLNEIVDISIEPRGSTALRDSMGKLILEVGEDLNSLTEDEKPDRVLFVTITDGEENSSVEISDEDLKKIISEQESKYSWNFTYIGANQDSFSTSRRFGGRMSNTLNYTATDTGIKKMFSSLNSSTTLYRSVSDVSYDTFSYDNDKEENKPE